DQGPGARRDRLGDRLRGQVVQAEEDLDAQKREEGGRLLGAGGMHRAHGLRGGCARGAAGRGDGLLQSGALRSRRALPMTEKELALMGALAIMGLSTIPRTG